MPERELTGTSGRLDASLVVLSYLLGGGSLVLFLVGPIGFLDLGLGVRGALAFDAALSLAFFLQHSGMVRRSAKARIGRLLPAHWVPAVYSIASGLVLAASLVLWQRAELRLLPDAPPRWIRLLGIALTVAGFWWAVAALRRFDPFGVGPVHAHRRARPVRPPEFVIRGPYRWVRHPLYLFMLVLIWTGFDGTADRLLFCVLWTAWIAIGTVLEERDLVAEVGAPYLEYRRRVPMLLPWRGPLRDGSSAGA